MTDVSGPSVRDLLGRRAATSNFVRYRRLPGYGRIPGNRRYYDVSNPSQTISEYRYRQYVRSLADEQRVEFNEYQQFQRRRATIQRRELATDYQRRLASLGIERSIGSILQDRRFNDLVTMLQIKKHELRGLPDNDKRFSPLYVETTGEVGSFLNRPPVYGPNDYYDVTTLNLAQLLAMLGRRMPTDNQFVGMSGDDYVTNVMVPYFRR